MPTTNRTLANLSIRSPYWWIIGCAVAGVILAEVLYFHVFGMTGFIAALFSITDIVKDQGWWNDERKGVWIAGALWGVIVAGNVVLRMRRLG